ncbi:MAG: hypothetical protein Satyrvirus21_19 [Satyrvirus sp.]|uniref:Uncharacterized protein n=1 Tax=Satyrvirus sp. TaxID=2487771 RepID=A0A3G5AE88_9VIRU|nr:MAG: hypothetical protein Satyrvirus21_19 [Satyrvirus sp.]
MKTATIILVIVAIIVMICGSLIDINDRRIIGNRFVLSKEHLWFAGIFILILAILIEVSDGELGTKTAKTA